MQENLKNILSHLSTEVDQETLLLYLQGKLSPDRQHDLEQQMMESDFNADALEGLQQFKSDQRLQSVVEQLNRDLKKKTARKKAFREKLAIKAEPWLLITLMIILLLAVIAFLVIYLHLKVSA